MFLGARFLGQVVKKDSLDQKQETLKILTGNWKALFYNILGFSCFNFEFFVHFLFLPFWRVQGSGEVSLGPKPSFFGF